MMKLGKWIAFNLVAALLLPVTSCAFAQEVKSEWTLWEEGKKFGTYATQQQAVAAIKTLAPPTDWLHAIYQHTDKIRSQEMSEDGVVRLTYWSGVEPPRDPDWKYSDPSAVLFETEAAAVAALAASYAWDATCGSKPVPTPVGGWVSAWEDMPWAGMLQARRYNISYLSGADCTPYTTMDTVGRQRRLDCPVPYTMWSDEYNGCVNETVLVEVTTRSLECDAGGGVSAQVGNPCDARSGDKLQPENDFDLGWVSFTRHFHSGMASVTGGFGAGWSHSHSTRLLIGSGSMGLVEGSGYQVRFHKEGVAYVSANSQNDRIVANGTGWKLLRTDSAWLFDARGALTEKQWEDGTWLRYAYDSYGRLSTLTHSTGRALKLVYGGTSGEAPITSITLDGIAQATYAYNTKGQVVSAKHADGRTRLYHYEDTRFPTYLTGITAEDGQRYSTFAYDALGRVVSSRHHDGIDGVTLSYPIAGGSTVTDALGRTTTYRLGASVGSRPRKLDGITDAAGTVSQTFYPLSSDYRQRLDTVTDRKGVKTKHTYAQLLDTPSNLQVNVHTTQEAIGLPQVRVSEQRHAVDSNRLVMSRVGAQETRITRNARLQPTTVVVKDTASGKARTTTMAYCESADVTAGTCPGVGLLKTVDGARTDLADVTRYQYYMANHSACGATSTNCAYRKGDLWKTVNALNQVEEVLAYDAFGRARSIKDANGIVTDLEYSPRGWLTARKVRGTNAASETDDQITRIEYWSTGLVKQVTQPDGSFIAYVYDPAQRVTDVLDGLGNRVHYTLDKAGNRLKEDTSDPQGALRQTLSRVYNTLGQLTTLKDAQSRATQFTYDANSNLSGRTDALSRVTSYTYDPLNRLSATVASVGGIAARTQLEYTALDQVTKVTDPKNLATTYTLNAMGEQTAQASPDTGASSATYDTAGNRLTETNARGITTTYRYDALGRPIGEIYPDALMNVSYVYDVTPAVCATEERFPVGRLSTMTDRSGNTAYCYNRFGQLTRKVQTTNGRSFTVQYAYTVTGLLSKQTYPDGTAVDYTHDGQGRITAMGVTPPGGSRQVLLSGAGYYPFGPSSGWTYGNGRKYQRVLDTNYRAQSLRDAAVGGVNVDFARDAVGNLTAVSAAGQSVPRVRFTYDALDRLTSLRDGPTSTAIESYTYDATGNRLSKTSAGSTQTYSYPTTSHRLSAVGAEARAYDAAGNTTSIGGTARGFTYNAANRLNQALRNGTVVASYHYNGRGERVRKIAGSSDVVSVYGEGGQWLGDYVASTGTAIQQVIWLDDLPVGIQIGPATAAARLHYLQPDHLGTPRAVIDPMRNVAVWSWDLASEAFGNSGPNEDPDKDGKRVALDMRFTGQRYDSATGLNYNYHRDYDTSGGRYVQSDPIGLEGGVSTYGYAGGKPLTQVDPLGLATYLMTTYDVTAGVRHGSHSATYIDGEHGEEPFLYDPSGHFGGDARPAGGVFEGAEADLDAYIQFHRLSGSEVVITKLGTTKINEKVIKERAMEMGDSRGFNCARDTSAALAGFCQGKISHTGWPSRLNEMAEKAQSCPVGGR